MSCQHAIVDFQCDVICGCNSSRRKETTSKSSQHSLAMILTRTISRALFTGGLIATPIGLFVVQRYSRGVRPIYEVLRAVHLK